jgi:hypothetical protein
MSEDGRRVSIPPFPPGYRASGVLLHVSSLPSPYGIGDVGPAALASVDRIHEARWQALPLGPTGYGNSPYQSLSSFAGNELLVSPDRGRIAPDPRLRGQIILGGVSGLRRRHPVQQPVARSGLGNLQRRGASGSAARFRSVLPRPGALARRIRPVPGAEAKVQGRLLPRMAGGAGPAYLGSPNVGPAGTRRPHRPGSFCTIPVVSSIRAPSGSTLVPTACA